MDTPPLISIIITNYNYARFLRQCIDSAIAVRAPNKEIIVVDDGSSDASPDIITSYGSILTPVLLSHNEGQAAAANAGFRCSAGSIVFFLDSDDLLLPEAAETVMKAWRPDVVKVQFPMWNIDATGNRIGTMFPNYTRAYSQKEILDTLLTTGLYHTPPTSGNAFARSFLENVFPVPVRGSVDATEGFDSQLNVLAPLYGTVVTVLSPLALYRTHGSNSWAVHASDDPKKKLTYYCQQDIVRTRYLSRKAMAMGRTIDPIVLNRNFSHMMFRVACRRFAYDGYPFHDESALRCLGRGYLATLTSTQLKFSGKVLLLVWFTAVALAPAPIALYCVKQRVASGARSPRLLRFLRMLGVIRLHESIPNG